MLVHSLPMKSRKRLAPEIFDIFTKLFGVLRPVNKLRLYQGDLLLPSMLDLLTALRVMFS